MQLDVKCFYLRTTVSKKIFTTIMLYPLIGKNKEPDLAPNHYSGRNAFTPQRHTFEVDPSAEIASAHPKTYTAHLVLSSTLIFFKRYTQISQFGGEIAKMSKISQKKVI